MNEYIIKINVIDGDELFREDIENGKVDLFFRDGGYAQAVEPDWNEIEDIIRSKKT